MVIWKFCGYRRLDAHGFLPDRSSATNSTSTAPPKTIMNDANGVLGIAKDSIGTNIFGATLQSEAFLGRAC